LVLALEVSLSIMPAIRRLRVSSRFASLTCALSDRSETGPLDQPLVIQFKYSRLCEGGSPSKAESAAVLLRSASVMSLASEVFT
jgi:hypothetical protein